MQILGKIQAWEIDNLKEVDNVKKISIDDSLSYKKNLTPNQYAEDLINTAMGINSDLQFKYVALSTAYDPPQKTDNLILEVARVVPVSINKIGKKIIIESKFDNTVFTKSVNITAVTDKKTFTISSPLGFVVGDRIQVKIGNEWQQRKLINITGSIFTVNEDFTVLPSVGTNNCQQMASRLHLVYGVSTLALNSGKAVSLAQLIAYKPSTSDIYTRHEIEILGS
jgi:hypothetical protein